MNGLDFGTAIGLIKGLGSPDPAVIESAVSDWLDDHPEATTTVQDGSITKAKLDSNLQGTVDDVADLKSQITGKVNVAQGVENVGKALVVGADGNVAPGDMSGGDVTTEQWLYSFPTDTVSGAVASFADGGDNLPVKGLTIGIEIVQSGSGTPSISNLRPITLWTAATVNANGVNVNVAIPDSAMVAAGTLNVTTGALTVTHIRQDLTGANTEGWTTSGSGNYVATAGASIIKRETIPISSAYLMGATPTSGIYVIRPVGNNTDFSTIDEWKAYLAQTPLQVCYELDTPATYQCTPAEVLSILGANSISADTGDILSLTYRADPTLYADKRSNATRSIIAGVEPTMTASKAYTTGQLLIVGDTLYKVAASIASGATLTPGTNVNPTTVAEQLLLLANA